MLDENTRLYIVQKDCRALLIKIVFDSCAAWNRDDSILYPATTDCKPSR